MRDEAFQWKIEVTIWHKGVLHDKQILGSLVSDWVMENDFDYFGDISLGILPSLSTSDSTKKFVIKIFVIEKVERYVEENLPIRMGIRPTPII